MAHIKKIQLDVSLLGGKCSTCNPTALHNGKLYTGEISIEETDEELRLNDGETGCFAKKELIRYVIEGDMLRIAFVDRRFYRMFDFLEHLGEKTTFSIIAWRIEYVRHIGDEKVRMSAQEYLDSEGMPEEFSSAEQLKAWAVAHGGRTGEVEYMNNRTRQTYHI